MQLVPGVGVEPTNRSIWGLVTVSTFSACIGGSSYENDGFCHYQHHTTDWN